jgi:predicted lipoprotein with Yx(FWY)xxD motif
MQSLRVSTLIGLSVLFLFLFAACGNASSTSAGTTPTATQSTSSYPTSAPTATPTTAASTGTSAVVTTATATVQGKSETILTNTQGLTLYYFTSDTPTTSACTGGCAGSWPSLVVTGSSAPTSATSLSGKLTAVSDANGMQVQYNSHFLYTFASDTAPGQTTGEGIGGKWFVATPDLT